MRSAVRLRALPFVLGAVLAAAVFVAVYLIFVRSYLGQFIDEKAFTGADLWKGAWVDFARTFLNVLPFVCVILGVIAAAVIVAIRRNWLVATVAVLAAAAANASTQVLKYTILTRPDKGIAAGLSNSLPSGHTTVAGSVALVIFLLVTPRIRPLAAVLGALFTVVAGAATLVEQWHRPSDVVAGMLVVAFWGCIAGIVLALAHASTTEHPGRTRLWPLLVAVGVCGIVAAIGIAVTVISAQNGTSHLFIAYAGGVGAMGFVGFGLASIGNRMFRSLA